MKSISKEDFARLRDYARHIEEARNDLDSFISDLQEKVGECMTKLNDWIDEANGFVSDLHGEAESYYDERSDNWRDGDAGESYREWLDELDEAVGQLESQNWTVDASEVLESADAMIEAINNIRQSDQE